MKKRNWITSEEQSIVSEWIASEQGQNAIESDVERKWGEYPEDYTQAFDHDKLFMKLKRRIIANQHVRKTGLRRILRYAMETAAAILITLTISLLIKEKDVVYKDVPQFVEVYNPKGVRTTITLPDSSKVMLNADTKLSYTDKFQGKTRTVTLTGEAFFEVAKDASRPFVVQANSATLTVLGTTFNVRSYPEDPHTEATLIEGALKVNNRLLAPGEQIVINTRSKTSVLQEVNPEIIVGWTKGELHFQSTTFAQMAKILERKFSVRIHIANLTLQERAFNGKFTKEENLEQILNVIQKTIDFTCHYDQESNTLTIK